MKTKITRRSGFTILELLIVLVILVGILAIVGPRLLGSQKKADIKIAQAQISNLETALKEYAADMKGFPKTEDGLKALVKKPGDEKKAKRWDGPYLEERDLPVDPRDNNFIYKYEPSKDGFDRPLIISKGPDGEENTDDDIYNFKPKEGGDADSDDSGESESDLDLGSGDSKSDFE